MSIQPSDAVAEWLRDLDRAAAVGSYSPQTVANYRADVLEWLRLMGALNEMPLDLDLVTASLLNDCFDLYLATPDQRFNRTDGTRFRSPRSQQRLYATLSRFFNESVTRGWVEMSPVNGTYLARGKTRRTTDPRRRAVSEHAAKSLITAAGEQHDERKQLRSRDEFVLRLLVESGPRVAEVSGANISDFVEDPGNECWWLMLRHTKGNIPRRVPVSLSTARLWLNYQQSERPCAQARPGHVDASDAAQALLLTWRGRRITPRDIQNILIRTSLKVNGSQPRVTPHGLRHTAATLLLESGVDVHVVRDILGHASIATTSMYLDSNSTDAAAAIRAHPVTRA